MTADDIQYQVDITDIIAEHNAQSVALLNVGPTDDKHDAAKLHTESVPPFLNSLLYDDGYI